MYILQVLYDTTIHYTLSCTYYKYYMHYTLSCTHYYALHTILYILQVLCDVEHITLVRVLGDAVNYYRRLEGSFNQLTKGLPGAPSKSKIIDFDWYFEVTYMRETGLRKLSRSAKYNT